MKRVAVVGAGISGLVTAHRLLELDGVRLDVYEAEPRAGGKIGAVRKGGFHIETGPNGFLDSRTETLELIDELGLKDDLLPAHDAAKRRYTVRNGKVEALPSSPLAFLRSPVLSLPGRLRVLVEGAVRKPPQSPDESIAQFARRRIGKEAGERLIDAMVNGIYAGDPNRLSMRSSFPRLVELEERFGSLTRAMIALRQRAKQVGRKSASAMGPGGRLTSLDAGMSQLTDALAAGLNDGFHTSHRLVGLSPRAPGWHLLFEVGDSQEDGRRSVEVEADCVVLAMPAHATSRVAVDLDPELARATAEIPYAPVAVVALGFDRDGVRHPLDGFGFVTSGVDRLGLLGCLWTSSIFPNRSPDGSVLLRTMVGGARDPGRLDLDDDELTAQTLDQLDALLGLRGDPKTAVVVRWPRAIPQYTVGHGGRLETIGRALGRLPGLFMAGNAYRGIGINDCVRESTLVAGQVAEYLRQTSEATGAVPPSTSPRADVPDH